MSETHCFQAQTQLDMILEVSMLITQIAIIVIIFLFQSANLIRYGAISLNRQILT